MSKPCPLSPGLHLRKTEARAVRRSPFSGAWPPGTGAPETHSPRRQETGNPATPTPLIPHLGSSKSSLSPWVEGSEQKGRRRWQTETTLKDKGHPAVSKGNYSRPVRSPSQQNALEHLPGNLHTWSPRETSVQRQAEGRLWHDPHLAPRMEVAQPPRNPPLPSCAPHPATPRAHSPAHSFTWKAITKSQHLPYSAQAHSGCSIITMKDHGDSGDLLKI